MEISTSLIAAGNIAIDSRHKEQAAISRGAIALRLIELDKEAEALRLTRARLTNYLVSGDPEVMGCPESLYVDA